MTSVIVATFLCPSLFLRSAKESLCPIPAASYSSLPLGSGDKSGHVWVECEVSGSKVKMIVDTGAGQTFITPKVATKLKLKVSSPIKTTFANGSTAEYRSAEIQLKVGVVTCESFEVAVMDLSPVVDGLQKDESIEIAGLLGMDFLRTHEAIIDLQNKRLHIRDGTASDRAILEGEWQATVLVHHGQTSDDEQYIRKARIMVRGNRIGFRYGNNQCSGLLSINPSERPKHLKILTSEVNGRPNQTSCVFLYEIRGDKLFLLMRLTEEKNADQPNEIKSTKENRCSLWIFERIKHELAPQPRMKIAEPVKPFSITP